MFCAFNCINTTKKLTRLLRKAYDCRLFFRYVLKFYFLSRSNLLFGFKLKNKKAF